MATYIEDEETSNLIDEYATFQKTTKTGALRELLRRELKHLRGPAPEERYQAALAYVLSAPTNGAIRNEEFESLYEYLDAD